MHNETIPILSNRELRASPQHFPKEPERNLIDTFQNMKQYDPNDQPTHYQQATSPLNLPVENSQSAPAEEEKPPKIIDSKNIMKSIFYQNNDNVDISHFYNDKTQIGINLQQVEFKSISHSDDKLNVHLELIEMNDDNTNKKRSMINVSIVPSNEVTVKHKQMRQNKLKTICDISQMKNLESVYSQLNEKFINEIIDIESDRTKFQSVRCSQCGKKEAN
jgi:hypothetical protein